MSERMVQQPAATKTQAKFSELPSADVQRSTFDMSHSWKGTTDTWKVIPTLCMEVLPGDSFKINSTLFMRLATPLKPIMDNLTADIHYFFVPNRLVWDNWKYFMGERKVTSDDPDQYSIPQANVDVNIRNSTGQLPDYFGIPLFDPGDNTEQIVQFSSLPFRAYQLIWSEWYRNQNVTGRELPPPTGDGPDDIDYEIEVSPITGTGLGVMGPRHKRADYFTRALPWPQKGDPVFLPLGEYASVIGIGVESDVFVDTARQIYETPRDGQEVPNPRWWNSSVAVGGDNSQVYLKGGDDPDDQGLPSVYTDLSRATAATINDIRTAFQIQKLLERDARGGTRYIEIILSHFNVQSPDARLQRPEYLGGGSATIVINPVAATVASEEAPQGNLSAVGTGLLRGNMSHSFTEHGHILALISTRSDLMYQKGVDKMWSRKTRYDYYWPALSHLGEQAILNKEVYLTLGDDIKNEGIWGYQERYAEYRYQPSRITGLFRSEHPESLDVWHLSQDFTELPALSPLFVVDLPPIDRVVAVPTEPDLIIDGWHNIKATRPMPIYAVPGLVDHF